MQRPYGNENNVGRVRCGGGKGNRKGCPYDVIDFLQALFGKTQGDRLLPCVS
jgi:hypothetical protein